jgi:hypothetical protein
VNEKSEQEPGTPYSVGFYPVIRPGFLLIRLLGRHIVDFAQQNRHPNETTKYFPP